MMEIKQLKPSKNSRFKQGYIRRDSCKKYFGEGPIIFRSSYERKFVAWLESCDKVSRWTSENVSIPYLWVDGKMHRYYPDYFVEMVDGSRILVEIKPYNQTHQPVNVNEYNLREWSKNKSKWEAALEFCKRNNMKFQIITEKTIDKL